MALTARRLRTRQSGDYWPGFVDALATLLLVLIFLVSIFSIAQFLLAQAVSGKDSALEALRAQVSELADLLALEQADNADLTSRLAALSDALSSAEAEQERLSALLSADAGLGERAAGLSAALEEERQLSSEARSEVELLNQQLSALRRQLATLEAALEAAEEKDREQRAQIADLGRRLNVALAQKVQELARARSEFFASLREVLGERAGIEVVGDRFVLQSEVLFDSGSAAINPDGREELSKVAGVVRELQEDIDPEIAWVLRVDGHSDANPINTAEFPSNWHLSAERAIAVVEYLTAEGVPPGRLVAAGFGEYQPLDAGTDAAAYKRNRRIEFKLTQR